MNNTKYLKEWQKLPDATKLNIFTETARRMGLPAIAIEKDWWVVQTLALVFSMECGPSLVFKGGTSLSKGWNLIERFSEDIDLALDREYLGFSGELKKADINKLRRRSYSFMTGEFITELSELFTKSGHQGVQIKSREVVAHDQDPITIEIFYPKLTEPETYLKPGVLVEVSCRSLKEPLTPRTFGTMVAENFSGQPFADGSITVPVVNPERTFLEKIFLLHEEFQKQPDKIKVDRLSRHLYDIEKLHKEGYSQIALQNDSLYNTVVKHRSQYNPITGIDYKNHKPENIIFIPPANLIHYWETDYKKMQENMIYGETHNFKILIQKLTALQKKINSLPWN